MDNNTQVIMSDKEYDSDEILSHSLGIVDEHEANKIFLLQNTYRDVPDEGKDFLFWKTLHVSVSTMLDIGGPSEIGVLHPPSQIKRRHEETAVNERNEVPARLLTLSDGEVDAMSRLTVPENTLR